MYHIKLILFFFLGVGFSFAQGEVFCSDPESNEKLLLQFPISFIMPDNSEIKCNNGDELITKIDEWYIENKEIQQNPIIAYPINIVFNKEDIKGNLIARTFIVNNDMELEEYMSICKDWEEEEEEDEYGFVKAKSKRGDNTKKKIAASRGFQKSKSVRIN